MVNRATNVQDLSIYAGIIGLLLWIIGQIVHVAQFTPPQTPTIETLQAHYQYLFLVEANMIVLGGSLFFWTIKSLIYHHRLRNRDEQDNGKRFTLAFYHTLPFLTSIVLVAFNAPLTSQLEPIVQSYLVYSILSAGPLLLFFVQRNYFNDIVSPQNDSNSDASTATPGTPPGTPGTPGTPETSRSSGTPSTPKLTKSISERFVNEATNRFSGIAKASSRLIPTSEPNSSPNAGGGTISENSGKSGSFVADLRLLASAALHGMFVVVTGASVFMAFVLIVPYMASKGSSVAQVDQALMIALAGGICGVLVVSVAATFNDPDDPNKRASTKNKLNNPKPRARFLPGLRFLMFFFSCVQWACFIGWITTDAQGFEYGAMCTIGFFLSMSGIGIFVGSSILSDTGFVYVMKDTSTETTTSMYHSGCAAVGSALLLLLIRLNTSSGLLNYTALSQTTAALSGVGSVCALLSWAAFKPFKK